MRHVKTSHASSPTPSEDLALIDRISANGRIMDCEPHQAAWLGYETADLIGADWSVIYPEPARQTLQALLERHPKGPVGCELSLRDAQGQVHPVCALVEVGYAATHQPDVGTSFRIFKWRNADFAHSTEIAEGKAVLMDILNASDDPSWCIEYAEPVDLSAPEQEIVRQFFENRRYWRFCNAAMGRFYRLPEDENLNDRPVREIFDRNPENEAFALFLLHNNFDVVRALSRDTRYDGSAVDVENDVRGLIRNNQLYRMWGTVRDVSKHLRRRDALRKRVGDLELALTAVPDALLLVDGNGIIAFANTATESLLGLPADLIVGHPFELIVDAEGGPDWLVARIDAEGAEALRLPVSVRIKGHDGPIMAELNARRFEARGQHYIAVTLRRVCRPRCRMLHPSEALAR